MNHNHLFDLKKFSGYHSQIPVELFATLQNLQKKSNSQSLPTTTYSINQNHCGDLKKFSGHHGEIRVGLFAALQQPQR